MTVAGKWLGDCVSNGVEIVHGKNSRCREIYPQPRLFVTMKELILNNTASPKVDCVSQIASSTV
jgi:hypothetical protein